MFDFATIPILPATRLRVGPADDPHEREADRVADTVTSGGVAPWIAARPDASGVRRQCETCAEEEVLQRDAAANAAGGWSAPPIVGEVLRSPGRPLDAGLRAELEPRFGHDFSTIRVHDDVRAAESARAVSAHAYTVGTDVVFAAGKGTLLCDELRAHRRELNLDNAEGCLACGNPP